MVKANSKVTVDDPGAIAGKRVLVIEDGPTLTHGGMPYGAGTVAAGQAGAIDFVDPRPYAMGSIADTLAAYPTIGQVLPATGYGPRQIEELRATIDAADCDVVVAGTPIDLRRVVHTAHPVRQARYELLELGSPTLADVLAPVVAAARSARPIATVP